MNFPFYIARRYLFSRSSNNAINIITFIAALGSIVATAALFVVLSGFSGLRTFSLAFFDVTDPDIQVTAAKGKTFQFTDSLAQIIHSEVGIQSYASVLEERAFFNYKDKEHIAILKGVGENYTKIVPIDTTLYAGQWLQPEYPYGIVVGNGISLKLNLGLDYLNPVSLYVPRPGTSYDITNPSSLVNNLQVHNIGIFAVVEDIDEKYAYAHLSTVQELLNYPSDRISAIAIKITKNTSEKEVAKSLQKKLGTNFKVQTRAQLNSVFYKMLNTENLVLYFIFTLVLIIALFNIIGALIMMIIDKKSNLKTLSNLGAEIVDIKRIFTFQGFLLSIFGLFVGLLIGLFLVYIQDRFDLFMITSYLAYPVEFQWKNIFIVVVTMLVLGYLAARIASSRIREEMLE